MSSGADSRGESEGTASPSSFLVVPGITPVRRRLDSWAGDPGSLLRLGASRGRSWVAGQ